MEYSLNTLRSALTMPSAVHLIVCFTSGSQHPRLSVVALLPLSPLHRFKLLTCWFEFYASTKILSIKNIFSLQVSIGHMIKFSWSLCCKTCRKDTYQQDYWRQKIILFKILKRLDPLIIRIKPLSFKIDHLFINVLTLIPLTSM